jgi:hypothetical protein
MFNDIVDAYKRLLERNQDNRKFQDLMQKIARQFEADKRDKRVEQYKEKEKLSKLEQ